MKKAKMVHHIVYSTKGGCGKTAFSLCMLLTPLSKLMHLKDAENQKEINYLLDLDFLGSSIMHCLPFGGYITMQDLIFRKGDIADIFYSDNEEIPTLYNREEDFSWGIIPAANQQSEKSIFQVKRKYTPLLKYDEFRHEIKGIQKAIKDYVTFSDERDYENLINYIYDLPPNSDGYTEAFFEEVFELKSKDKDNDNEIILYIVYNSDSMLLCNLDWLKTFLDGGKDRRCKIILVYTMNQGTGKIYTEEMLNSMIKEYHIEGVDISYIIFKNNVKIHNLYQCPDDASKKIEEYLNGCSLKDEFAKIQEVIKG